MKIFNSFDLGYCSFPWVGPNTVFCFIIIAFLGCNSEVNETTDNQNVQDIVELTVNEKLLELRATEGLVYYQNRLFTGYSETYYINNQASKTLRYIAGKKDGLQKKYFEDGTLSFEAHYKKGLQHGSSKTWWKNGNLRSESYFNEGIGQGMQKQYYQSGAKFKFIHLVDGKEEGLQQSWRENGKLYNNYEAKNGRVFGLKRSQLCYQLKDEVVQIKD